jgi:hypothetical protein
MKLARLRRRKNRLRSNFRSRSKLKSLSGPVGALRRLVARRDRRQSIRSTIEGKASATRRRR